uniref:Predicted protein n=1 Tax=Hordeum vulgare subsp. vulgare TaxID=112509 RepID=F2CXL4_HORVV|nr:predicted protein [Hordeum vulgare subsp. vulgare]
MAGVMRTQGPPMEGLRGRMNAGGTMEESRVRQVSLEQHWSTRMGLRGQCFMVSVKCAISVECKIYSNSSVHGIGQPVHTSLGGQP